MQLETLPTFCDSSAIQFSGTLNEDGLLSGTIHIIKKGNQAGELLSAKGMNPRERMLYAFDMLTSFYPLAELDSFDLDLSKPEMVSMDIHFHRDFGQQKNMIILPLPVEYTNVPQMERDNPIHISQTTFSSVNLNIAIPEDFTVVEIPENSSHKGNNFSYSSTYDLSQSTLSASSQALLIRGFIDNENEYRDMQLLRSREIRLVVKEK